MALQNSSDLFPPFRLLLSFGSPKHLARARGPLEVVAAPALVIEFFLDCATGLTATATLPAKMEAQAGSRAAHVDVAGAPASQNALRQVEINREYHFRGGFSVKLE